MAACPTTIAVYTKDKVNFPIKYVDVVVKQLFQYGVKEISVKDYKIFIQLTYSPRALTLKRKFGNLPLRYMRTKMDNNDEFRIFEKIVRRYKFNLLDEEDDPNRPPKLAAGPSSSVKRKLTIDEV